MPRLDRRTLLAAALAAPLARPALGQGAWPTRPIRIVIPFGTGGGTDITTRTISAKLQINRTVHHKHGQADYAA